MRPNSPSKDRGRVQAGVTPTPDSRVFVGVSGHAGILSGNTPPSPSTAAKCGALGGRCGSAGVLKKGGGGAKERSKSRSTRLLRLLRFFRSR